VRTAWDLVTAVAAHGVESREPLLVEPLDDDSWAKFFTLLKEQRLIGLGAAAAGAGEIPLSARQHVDVDLALHESTMTTLFLELSLVQSVELLSDAKIDYRVMKGAAAARLDYPDPILRPYIDVDLVVPASSFDAAVALFSAHGCTRQHPQPRAGFDRRFAKGTTFLTPAGHELDLHRTFVDGAYGILVHADDLFETATTFHLAGHDLLALGAEERFLQACFHARLGNKPARLLPLRDIVQLLLRHSLDLDRIFSRCDAWQAEPVVAEAVQLAWETLGVRDDVPLSTWAAGRTTTKVEQRRLAAYRDVWNYPALCRSAFQALPRISDKFAYLGALALPDREYLGDRYRGHVERWWSGARRLVSSASHTHSLPGGSQWPKD
jgi:hypothetical protein